MRILLKGIREARQSKVRAGLVALNPSHLQMPHTSSLELNELRGFFTLAHKRLVLLDPDQDLHQTISNWFLENPDKALNLAPGVDAPEGGENRLVEAARQHLLGEDL